MTALCPSVCLGNLSVNFFLLFALCFNLFIHPISLSLTIICHSRLQFYVRFTCLVHTHNMQNILDDASVLSTQLLRSKYLPTPSTLRVPHYLDFPGHAVALSLSLVVFLTLVNQGILVSLVKVWYPSKTTLIETFVSLLFDLKHVILPISTLSFFIYI